MEEFLNLLKEVTMSDVVKISLSFLAGSVCTLTFQKFNNISKSKSKISQKIKGNNNIQSGGDSYVQK